MIRVRAACEQLFGSENMSNIETDRKRVFCTIKLERGPNIQSKSKSCRKFQRGAAFFLPPSETFPIRARGQAQLQISRSRIVRPPPRLREYETWEYHT